MKKEIKKADRLLQKAFKACKKAGLNVTCVVSEYRGKKSAHFSTKFSLNTQPKADLTDNHILLDHLREMLAMWHDLNHKSKLKFKK